MNIIVRWIVTVIAIAIAAWLLPGVEIANLTAAIIAGLVLSLINLFIKPIVLLFTLPINVLTLGLFSFVINALLILLTARIVPGLDVGGFWWALLFSIVISIVTSLLSGFDDRVRT